MLPYTDGISFPGFGSLDTGVTDRFVARSDFKLAISKAFSAVFIAGFTSDKLFVKILTAVTYLTLALLGVLAVYVFSAPWIECVL
jgi:hypothetical protein